MIPPASIASVLKRAALCAALALLTGCAISPKEGLVEVSSPPPPSSGTQRIMAYDAYAATLFPARAPATVAVTDPDEKHSITSTLN